MQTVTKQNKLRFTWVALDSFLECFIYPLSWNLAVGVLQFQELNLDTFARHHIVEANEFCWPLKEFYYIPKIKIFIFKKIKTRL